MDSTRQKLIVFFSLMLFASAFSSRTFAVNDEVCSDSSSSIRIGMANPAAVYCIELGYEYKTIDTPEGQQGVCMFPDGSECNAWNFLMGKYGQEYSYCAQNGYDIATLTDGRNPYSREYAVCIRKGNQTDSSFQGGGTIIGSVTELMGIGKKATKGIVISDLGEATEVFSPGQFLGETPSSFDWRNYNGQNWMTSVKNQGFCGSCWAFAAVGTTEARFNIQLNNPNLDLDLSEQYLVSDCYTNVGTCCGGFTGGALEFMKSTGVPDESCMPYVDGERCYCDINNGICYSGNQGGCTYKGDNPYYMCSASTCSDRCSDWEDRIIKIRDTKALYQPGAQVIKDYIANRGPLAVFVGWGHAFGMYEDGGILRCTDDSRINHAVVLVGYNDARGYWIVKNSWGADVADYGYMKIGYGECSIERYVYAVTPCQDNDGDGYFVGGDHCGPKDCHDAEPTVYPGAEEACEDLLDNDCDGFTDCGDIDCTFYPYCSYRIPDTGQIKCYDNTQEITCPQPGEPFFRQDAEYITNRQSFTKLDVNGNDLPDEATEWVMVRDNVTGLIWEVKHDLNGIPNYANPNDADNTYDWSDSLGDGTGTEDFINLINTVHFAGYSDWRLPTIKELSTLVDNSIYDPWGGPVINWDYFPETYPNWYWSSTTYVGYPATAWAVQFDDGSVTSFPHECFTVRPFEIYCPSARAVRGGLYGSLHNFVDNGDGTVTDTVTGLMWEVKTDDSGPRDWDNKYTWQQALSYCENLTLAGHDDWRLPNRNELQTIVDYSRYNLSIDPIFSYTKPYDYFTSTTMTNAPYFAWSVEYNYGHGSGTSTRKLDSSYVRAVRGQPCGSFNDRDGDGICDDGDGNGEIGYYWSDSLGDGTVTEDYCIDGHRVFCDDNCPDDYNVDQLNSDNQNGGDVCDPCPADPTDDCEPSGSEAEMIDEAGGVLTTPNLSCTAIIPPGAVNTNTTFSITSTGSNYELETDLGIANVVFGAQLASNQEIFNQPITIHLAWRGNNSGELVYSFYVPEEIEDHLFIVKNGEVITSTGVSNHCDCLVPPDLCEECRCDLETNYFEIDVSSFSEYALAVPLDSDGDGIPNNFNGVVDSCPNDPDNDIDKDTLCGNVDNCPYTPNPTQQDSYPPQGNNCGDVCECHADCNLDQQVELQDLTIMKEEFYRMDCFINPCQADCDYNNKVDLKDLVMMKGEFFRTDCPVCH